MKHHRIKTLLAFLLIGFVSAGCGGSKSETKDDEQPVEQSSFNWKDQVLKLEVSSAQMMLNETRKTGWSGTGIIIEPGIMLTNAHVAMHAEAIKATTDNGEMIKVTHVLAIDQDADMAVLRVEAPGAVSVPLIERPEEPTSLRTESVVAIGNTANLGLSFYNGVINNVTDPGFGERIFHNANISSGASGGPLFDKETKKLIGVNHAISHGLRTSLAVPAWTVSELVAKAEKSNGRPLDKAFKVDATTKLKETDTKKVCLAAQSAKKFVFPAKQGMDVGIKVEVDNADKPFAYNLHYAYNAYRMHRLASSPVIHDSSSLGFTTPKSGYYVVEIGNVGEAGSGTSCATVTMGAVDWEASFASN